MAPFNMLTRSFMGKHTRQVHTADRKAKSRVNLSKHVIDMSELFLLQDHTLLN